MANSTPTQDSCVCVYAFPGPLKRTNPNQDQLTVEISVSLGAVLKNPVRKPSPRIHQTSGKTFHHPRQAFLSATHDQQSDIISKMVQSLETPFPLEEHIHWGLNFPADETASKLKNLDEIIAVRLSEIARRCAENDQIGYMDIRIRKLEKMEPEEYRGYCAPEVKQPLDDWILENQENVNSKRNWCLEFIYKLHQESPKDNKYYGLKSVKMEEESSGDEAEIEPSGSICSICINVFKKNSQGIRLPCSHIFHGLCIFQWLEKSPTCPVCRFQLFIPKPRETIA